METLAIPRRMGRQRASGIFRPPVMCAHFDALRPHGTLLVGNPEAVAQKIRQEGEALGGLARLSFWWCCRTPN